MATPKCRIAQLDVRVVHSTFTQVKVGLTSRYMHSSKSNTLPQFNVCCSDAVIGSWMCIIIHQAPPGEGGVDFNHLIIYCWLAV